MLYGVDANAKRLRWSDFFLFSVIQILILAGPNVGTLDQC